MDPLTVSIFCGIGFISFFLRGYNGSDDKNHYRKSSSKGKKPRVYDPLNDIFRKEEHHPGRLAGPTVSIPKIVHDFIHQDERDAVKSVFKEDGITGFHPGRWTGKRISHEFNPIIETVDPLPNPVFKPKPKTSPLDSSRNFIVDFNRLYPDMFKKKKSDFSLEFSDSSIDYFSDNASFNLSSPGSDAWASIREKSEAFNRAEWSAMDHMARTAPNGYTGGPVIYTPADGWQSVNLDSNNHIGYSW